MPLPPVRPGDLLAFQIGTQDGYSPVNQHRWGVIKVLHLKTVDKSRLVTVSVLDGLHQTCPTPLLVRLRPVLVEQRFRGRPKAYHTGRPLILTGDATTLPALTSARIIGHEWLLRPAERRALPGIRRAGHGGTMGHFSHAATTLDHEDRARHDSANWRNDQERSEQRWRDRIHATTLRRNTRLRGLTLATLLTETPLAPWDARPGLVPPDITQQIRDRARALMLALAALGPKVPRASARKLLSDFVIWLNQIDATQGGLFETQEREDLMTLIEDLCWAIHQKPLLNDLDALRTW